MFRAKDVILYKKIRFRFSSEGFVDIPKKSIKCIFAYLSFLGKLLKEFRHGKFAAKSWLLMCLRCSYTVSQHKKHKNTFSEDIFQKKVEKIFEFPILKSTRYPSFVSKRLEIEILNFSGCLYFCMRNPKMARWRDCDRNF